MLPQNFVKTKFEQNQIILKKILKLNLKLFYLEWGKEYCGQKDGCYIKPSQEIDIKLSNNNIRESLKLVADFLHSDELKDIKIIDARIKNQIILNV